VPTQFCLTLPEGFARKSLDAISRDRTFHQTLRHNEREPRVANRIDDAVKHEALRARNAARLERRTDGGGMEPLGSPQASAARQTASRARPFARRARMTARPPRVRILTRKP